MDDKKDLTGVGAFGGAHLVEVYGSSRGLRALMPPKGRDLIDQVFLRAPTWAWVAQLTAAAQVSLPPSDTHSVHLLVHNKNYSIELHVDWLFANVNGSMRCVVVHDSFDVPGYLAKYAAERDVHIIEASDIPRLQRR